MASKQIRFIIPQADYDAVNNSHWSPYSGAPGAMTQLQGYVMFTLKNIVQEKIDMFQGIKGCQTFETLKEIRTFKEGNVEIFVNPE
jgi:hypothetical protein